MPATKKNSLERRLNMAKSIITQNGTIINYSNLLAVYVDEDLDDNENILGFDLGEEVFKNCR